jgi:hypothetical protein
MQLSSENRSYSRCQRPKAPTAPAAGLRLYSAGAGAVAAGTARQQLRAVNDGRCRRFLGGRRARRPLLRGVADGQPMNGARSGRRRRTLHGRKQWRRRRQRAIGEYRVVERALLVGNQFMVIPSLIWSNPLHETRRNQFQFWNAFHSCNGCAIQLASYKPIPCHKSIS